jgi:hypothetical protein
VFGEKGQVWRVLVLRPRLVPIVALLHLPSCLDLVCFVFWNWEREC